MCKALNILSVKHQQQQHQHQWQIASTGIDHRPALYDPDAATDT